MSKRLKKIDDTSIRTPPAPWAAPKDASSHLDHNAALTGDDLIRFVNTPLFSYLQRGPAPLPRVG